MTPGDLVYHRDDIKDGIHGPVPGLIIRMHDGHGQAEAIVYFTDRTFGEYHELGDLVRVKDYKGENK